MRHRNIRLLIDIWKRYVTFYSSKWTAIAMSPDDAPSISVLSEANGNAFPPCKHTT
jgi:hypothetical protein